MVLQRIQSRHARCKLSVSKVVRIVPVLLLIFGNWICAAQPSSVPGLDVLSAEQENAAREFGGLVERLSGEGGYFDTDNLISNESSYLHVIPRLNKLELKGGAYIGVGPDQNFSYIAHLEPELAIILDIRRDNMLTHLLYKALFELSEDRVSFLGNLFARYPQVDSGEAQSMDVNTLLDIVENTKVLEAEQLSELVSVMTKKVEQLGVTLSEDDLATIQRIHREFIDEGPGLRFTSHGRAPQSYYPTYRQLATETTVAGKSEGFLSQEIYYQRLKKMHESNRIVPAVGNFAGLHALPEIGKYLQEENLEVSAFYTSNVEFYLMYQQDIDQFAANVAQLPLKERSVFIRSYFNRWRAGHPLSVPGYGSTQILQHIRTMLDMPDPDYRDLILEDVLSY